MQLVASLFVALVAVLHLYFLYLEMFAWTTPRGRKVFNTTPEFAEASSRLAANQGLYNGFLSAGLLYGLAMANREFVVFFLGCVIVAGLYGAYSVNKRILFVQALPATLALALTLLS